MKNLIVIVAAENYLPPAEHYQQLSIMPNVNDAEADIACSGA